MNLLPNKADCCGCGACAQRCPNGSIAMHADGEGFLYPEIDMAKCVHCGACKSVCFVRQHREGVTDYEIVAAKSKDEKIKYECSSGGIFPLLAEAVIEQGGVVFGVGFDESFAVCHSAADTKEELQKFRKSKYVQSDTGNTYVEAETLLKAGKPVLYSGTPCQIAGLKAFLGKDYDWLYCVDLICTGASSPEIWSGYLECVQNKSKSQVASVIFRDKEINDTTLSPNQRNLTVKLLFDGGERIYQYSGTGADENIFFQGFLDHLYLRPACHQCKAKSFMSGSDIQLGDFWRIHQKFPEFCDKAPDGTVIPFGVSIVILLSKKGRELFDAIKEHTIHFHMNDADCAFTKKRLFSSKTSHPNRSAFFEERLAATMPVDDLIRKHLNAEH